MAFFVPWLVNAARLTGYPVVEVGGWRTHGHGGMRVVEGVVAHHTADGPSGNYPSLRVVRDGRAGLRGPLSQIGLGRDGTVYIIAAGLSYHAGASDWSGFRDLNDEFIGIEAESVGTRDDWTPEQRDCYPRLVAAFLFYMRRPASRLGGHKEVCRPRGRKIDPAYWNMDAMRRDVDWMLQDPLRRIPRSGTAPPQPQPGPPDTPTIKAGEKMGMQVIEIPANLDMQFKRISYPVGSVSAITNRAWISLVCNGPEKASARMWAQGDSAGIADKWFNVPYDKEANISGRDWWEIPSGTTQINMHLHFPNGGAMVLEWEAK